MVYTLEKGGKPSQYIPTLPHKSLETFHDKVSL